MTGQRKASVFTRWLLLTTALLTAYHLPLTTASAQPDADAILDRLKASYNRIQDYQVDVTVKVDVDFVRIPVRRATMYYKRPDKVRFRTTGFTLMPKRGSSFNLQEFLRGSYTAIYAGAEVVQGVRTTIIKIIPLESESPFVLSTLWVDTAAVLVRRAEVNTREGGAYTMLMEYGNTAWPLPSKLTATFSVARVDIPVAISGDLASDREEKPAEKGGRAKGTVIITYTGYRVNQGLGDELFRGRK